MVTIATPADLCSYVTEADVIYFLRCGIEWEADTTGQSEPYEGCLIWSLLNHLRG